MANEWKKVSRQKRGGGQALLSLDWDEAESRLHVPEPQDDTTPDILFERQWVLTLLEHVLKELGKRDEADGKSQFFSLLKPALTPGAPMSPYAEIAAQLDMSESSLKVAVHRLRQRYGAMLKAAIADTQGPDEDADAEWSHLMTVFS